MPADPSDRTAIEAELRTQKLHLEMIFNSARDMMMLAKVEAGEVFRVVAVNRPYVESIRAAGFPLAAGDFTNRTLGEVLALFGLSAAENAEIRGRFEEVIRTGRQLEFAEVTRTPSGAFHGRTTITPILNEAGACAFVLYSSQDVTATVRAEQARRESEDKFAKAFRATPDAIAITDLETGRFLEANGSYERIFGGPADSFIGRTTVEMGFYQNPADRQRLVDQIRATGSVHNVELHCYNQRREPVVVLYSGESIEMNGRKCLVSVIHDITERRRSEQARRESEEKFATAFRLSPNAMSIASLEDGRYLEINQAHQEIFGYRPEEIIGRTAAEIGMLPDSGVTAGALAQLRATGRVRDLTVAVRTRGGEVRTIVNNAELIRVGGRECALLTSQDITERLRAEQALHESEEKFARAFLASPDAMSVHELESGRYVDVNEGFLQLFGGKREEIVGRTALELGLWVDPTGRQEFVDRLRRDGRVRNFQVTVRVRDGRLRICELSAEMIEIGGRPHNVTVLNDITESLEAEQSLRASEEKFAKAFRASPYSLTISEMATGRYVDVNGGFEQLSGYTREEVIGRTSLELNLWIDPAERDTLVRRLQEKGTVRGLELHFRTKDGQVASALCNCEPIEVAGVSCLLTVLEDTTERRRAEVQKASLEAQLQQNQKLEALGTLAGGIAHDFNNILTAIIVNQELALMDIGHPADLRRRLAEIGQASGRAKELVRQILTFSRQQTHERLRQPLQMIIREALGLLRSSLPATIEIKQELSPEAPPVLADASQIHQVVMNLCTNAAHAMRDHPGCITVRLAPWLLDEAACLALPGLKPGRYAWLSVTDTGHGMDASVLEKIFEPFFTTKDPGEGTGLGLPMVHGIVRNHDGAIFVQSSPGNGASFDLYFPAAPETASEARVIQMGIVSGRGEIVLVVDDEEAICEAIGAMLTRIGYRVQTFTDPQAALEHFRKAPSTFDLLLTDRTMPRMSGQELIARVRDWWPGLPALLMSGMNNGDGPGGQAPEADYGLVAKPIDIADLSRAVRQALDRTPSQLNAPTPSP
jgi:two-component system cell cycle sensor histidine kinase/response regulator CckA